MREPDVRSMMASSRLWPYLHVLVRTAVAIGDEPRSRFSLVVTGSRWDGFTHGGFLQRWSMTRHAGIGPTKCSYDTRCPKWVTRWAVTLAYQRERAATQHGVSSGPSASTTFASNRSMSDGVAFGMSSPFHGFGRGRGVDSAPGPLIMHSGCNTVRRIIGPRVRVRSGRRRCRSVPARRRGL